MPNHFTENKTVYVTAAITVATIGLNLWFAMSGISQKLSCTLEQTKNVATAVLATPIEK